MRDRKRINPVDICLMVFEVVEPTVTFDQKEPTKAFEVMCMDINLVG